MVSKRNRIPIKLSRYSKGNEMKPTSFPQQNIVFAKDQPQYRQLPAYRSRVGEVTTCWKLTWWDRIYLLFTGRMWLRQLTFNHPLQPQLPSVKNPLK